MSRTSSALAALVLAGALLQVRIGPLPVSTLILAVSTLWFIFRYKRFPFPVIHWTQMLFISGWAIGLLGSVARPTALKETVQLLEIMIVTPWLFRNLRLEGGEKQVARVFSLTGLLILILYACRIYSFPPAALSSAKAAAYCVIAFPFVLYGLSALSGKQQMTLLITGGMILGLTAHHGWVLICFILLSVLLIPVLKNIRRAGLIAGLLLMIGTSCIPLFRETNVLKTLSPHYKGIPKRTLIEVKTSRLAPRYLPMGSGPGMYLAGINRLRTYTVDVPHPEDEKVPQDGNCQYTLTLVETGLPSFLFLIILIPGAGIFLYIRGFRKSDETLESLLFTVAVCGAALAGCFSVILSRGIGVWVGAIIGLLYKGRTRFINGAVPVVFLCAGFLGLYVYNEGDMHISELNMLFRNTVFGDFREPPAADDPGLEIIDLENLTEKKTEIRIEAESCVRVTEPMLLVPANEVSGGKVLRIPAEAKKGKGFAVYQFDVPETGFYTLKARVLWKDGCSNSLKFEVGSEARLIASDTFKRWHTLNAKKNIQLLKGNSRAVVYGVEPGISMDYFILELSVSD